MYLGGVCCRGCVTGYSPINRLALSLADDTLSPVPSCHGFAPPPSAHPVPALPGSLKIARFAVSTDEQTVPDLPPGEIF